MRDCPHCNVAVDGMVCPQCGFVDPNAPRLTRADTQVDQTRFLCAHMDRGMRCSAPGSLTESTRGAEHWYCAAHFPPFSGRYAKASAAPAGGFRPLKALLGVKAVEATEIDEEARLEREAIRVESIQQAEVER